MNIIEVIVSLRLLNSGSSNVESWRAIVPLHSTRADVEQLLGAPLSPCKCDYRTKTERVFIVYSGEPCEGHPNRWRVPRDTVIEMTVHSEAKPKLSDLKLDRRRFKKTKDPELYGYLTYEDENEGVAYAVSNQGIVYSVHRFASSKDDKALRCASVTNTTSTESAAFDRINVGLTFEEDKIRLDQFAANIRKAPDAKGYIIVYASELGPARIARMRLKCSRDYLRKIHRIKSSRLVMIDGGYRDDISVELFLVRPGDPIPKPKPTRRPAAVHDVPPRVDPCR